MQYTTATFYLGLNAFATNAIDGSATVGVTPALPAYIMLQSDGGGDVVAAKPGC